MPCQLISARMLSSITVPRDAGCPDLWPSEMIPQRLLYSQRPSGSVLWRITEPSSEPSWIAYGLVAWMTLSKIRSWSAPSGAMIPTETSWNQLPWISVSADP